MIEKIQRKYKLEFKDLILEHIEKILELTLTEFKGGYDKEIAIGNQIVKEYIPDSRKQYIQSVESLSDILSPHFDEEMQKVYNEIEKEINSLTENMKKKEKISDKEVREYTLKKLELCRRLFRELNFFLDRVRVL